MRLTFIHDSLFVAQWRSLRLTDDDLQALERMLASNPQAGAVMAGTGGLRKVRFAPPSRHTGKSGSARVGYVYFVVAECIVLATIFPKNEKANLSASEKSAMRNVVKMYRDALTGE